MKKRWKLYAAAAGTCAFLASCLLTCAALGGFNIWQLPAAGGLAAAFYPETEKIPVIVIDPGHGGIDGGAQARDGTMEKDLNLAIALCLAEELKSCRAEVILTRTDDSGLYEDDGKTIRQKKREDLLERKSIIENSGADIAVSIHLNSFPRDESIYGAQVFYPKEHEGRTNVRGEGFSSKDYAQAVQKALKINIPDGSNRQAMAKNDVLLMKNIKSDIILVECGFLSNHQEAELLKTTEYQRLVSRAIKDGLDEILCLEKREEIQIIYSTNKRA